MIMSMCVLRIWGCRYTTTDIARARAAGWSHADLIWECLMERANERHQSGAPKRAMGLFRRADWLARLCFADSDVRRITAAAGRAMLAIRLAGSGADHTQAARAARRRLTALLHFWQDHADAAIAQMHIAPRARSSLFHLRMETRHGETFRANMRTRLHRFAGETAETLQSMAAGDNAGASDAGSGAASHRHYARWRGARPPLYDDSRKILGACLLLPDSDTDADTDAGNAV